LIKRVGFLLLLVVFWPGMTVTAHVTSSSFSPQTAQQTTHSGQSNVNVLTTLMATSAANPAPELPLLDVDFCGECLPFDQTSVVDRWKHVFTLFRSHSSGDLGSLRERADKFFPVIDPILTEYDIPSDFRYIPLAESGLRPKAVSRAGAAGYWQLMPGTARALGLKVNSRVDERFNVQKATTAACRYLRQLYDQLGSWSLVAAAYNAGPGYLQNQLRRTDHRDYYRMSLPRETKYYLFRVLVYKEVMSRPDDYSAFLTPPVKTAYQDWAETHQTYLS
jgi:membrane-bound lytic murein transglycosylase D